MTDLAQHLRAASWWLLPLAALLLIIGWETGWGRAFERRPAPLEPIAPKPVATSLLPEYTIAGGPAGHTEMVQRTLFNPTRRPAPAAPVSAAGQLQRGQFALTGTLVIDGKSTAFLREVAGNKPRRVLAGDRINGMLVAEVKPDRVRLSLGDESEELTLRVVTNPRPTVAQVAPVTAAAPVPTPASTPAGTPTPPVAAGTGEPAQQTLAERRRAARAAAAGDPAAAPPVPAGAVAPPVPAGAATPPAALDPRWGQMDQAYRERAATTGNRPATK